MDLQFTAPRAAKTYFGLFERFNLYLTNCFFPFIKSGYLTTLSMCGHHQPKWSRWVTVFTVGLPRLVLGQIPKKQLTQIVGHSVKVRQMIISMIMVVESHSLVIGQ